FDDIPNEPFSDAHTFTRHARNPDRAVERERLAQYYAAVTMIDQQIGRLLDELASRGTLENTLIVYTSDHGHNCGHHGIWMKGNATLPANFLDESILVPAIFHWPGHVLEGDATREPFDHCDLHATLCDVAGLTPDATLPGRSYWPRLTGKPQA